MAKARPDYPAQGVSERAKSISLHKGAEGTKLPPPVRMAVRNREAPEHLLERKNTLCVAVVVLCITAVPIWSFIISSATKLRKLFYFCK